MTQAPARPPALMQWRRSACAHRDMVAVRVTVASQLELDRFLAVLRARCAEQAPTLLRCLPTQGRVPVVSPEDSLACLRELDRFERSDQLGTETVLVDTRTGRVVQRSLTPTTAETRPGTLVVNGEVIDMPSRRRDRTTPAGLALPDAEAQVLRMEERALRARQFARLLRPLAELFSAALTQDNPVTFQLD